MERTSLALLSISLGRSKLARMISPASWAAWSATARTRSRAARRARSEGGLKMELGPIVMNSSRNETKRYNCRGPKARKMVLGTYRVATHDSEANTNKEKTSSYKSTKLMTTLVSYQMQDSIEKQTHGPQIHNIESPSDGVRQEHISL